jgi:alpha-mannosidase
LRSLTPAAIRSDFATFECAYGVVRRSTHANTSWDQAKFEVPAHRFADLSEPDFGLAILNNAKYGHSERGDIMGLSLVRSPIYSDPLADEGLQSFTYSLMPHAGGWSEGGVREEAEDLNQPLLAVRAQNLAAGEVNPLNIRGIPVALSGLKPSEDGEGLILRVYEPRGGRGEFSFDIPKPWKNSAIVNLLEEPVDAAPGLLPFQVKSWLLKRQ